MGGGILGSLTSDLPDRSPELERTYIVLSNLARKLIFKESNLVSLLQNLLFNRDRMPEPGSVDDVGPRHLDAIDGVRVCICLQMTDFIQCAKTRNNLTKNGVLTVLGRDRLETNVELASI